VRALKVLMKDARKAKDIFAILKVDEEMKKNRKEKEEEHPLFK